MLNQIVLVGRIVENPTIQENENGKVATITLTVPRSYKNVDGEYEKDYIPCVLWNGVASNVCEYCKKGDLVGIKGKLQKGTEDAELRVVAEKVTFLSSNSKED